MGRSEIHNRDQVRGVSPALRILQVQHEDGSRHVHLHLGTCGAELTIEQCIGLITFTTLAAEWKETHGQSDTTTTT